VLDEKVDPGSYVVEIALWMKNNAGHSTKRSKALSLSAFIVQILIVYSCNIFVLKSIDRARQSGFLLFLPFSSRKKACVSLTLLFGSSRTHALAKYKNNRMYAARNFPQHKEKIGAFILACVPRDVCVLIPGW
jgi:hypothetical protein